MILLVAPPSPIRTTFASFLEQEGLSTKVCENIETATQIYHKTPQFDMVVLSYRLPDGTAQSFLSELNRKRYEGAVVVIGAPLKTEAALYRAGALAVLGAGFSPRSAALQCMNLNAFITRKAVPKVKVSVKTLPDFNFGAVAVSPEQRVLMPKRDRGAPVPLSRLQIRLLQALGAAPGKILDYEYIFHTVWRRAYRGNNAAIREAVSSVRKRFRRAGFDFGSWVATVHGEGYRYDRA